MILLSILVKVTFTTTLTLIGVRFAKKSRAAVRHLALAAGLALLVIVPLASLVAPAIRVEMPIGPADVRLSTATSSGLPPHITATPIRGRMDPASQPSGSPIASWSARGLSIWIAGALLAMLPVVVGLWQVRRLSDTGVRWPEGQAIADAMASGLRLRRPIGVLLHVAVSGPVTFGVRRPTILFPMDGRSWASADLARSMSHELAHVRRCDWVSQCLARAICAIYWFHPLVWIARHQLTLEAERACDDAVLRRSTLAAEGADESAAYARQLVDLASRQPHYARLRQLSMASRTDLPTRVRAVLNPREPRGRAGLAAVVVACAAAALVATTMSPIQIVAAQNAKKRFDIAAIRECGPESPRPAGSGGRGSGGGNVTTSTGRVIIDCATVALLVRKAYNDAPRVAAGEQVAEFNNMSGPSAEDHPLVRGLPSWAGSVRYQIEATAPPDADRLTMVGPMLQTLLEERFKLAYHWATEDIPVYAMTVSKGGLKIEPQTCVPYDPAAAPEPVSINTHASQTDLSKLRCGLTLRAGDGVMMTGTTLTNFAWTMSANLDRPMLDKTGVSDRFNILLVLDPATVPVGGVPPTTIDPAPMLQALEQQIGLKIERTKALFRYIAVDHIQKPVSGG